MDHPAGYDGGVSHLFKRAEQAANVGREISLQYTHAHIRYIEAMAKAGDPEEVWDSLFVINPIQIRHSVKNARIRQSNMYFSSSDRIRSFLPAPRFWATKVVMPWEMLCSGRQA